MYNEILLVNFHPNPTLRLKSVLGEIKLNYKIFASAKKKFSFKSGLTLTTFARDSVNYRRGTINEQKISNYFCNRMNVELRFGLKAAGKFKFIA